ncbi:hypothetical protein [Paraburkholderia humisilvae]|uniref:Bacterial Ig domain-containing protein n=1 Tax=Paraburkholderia humisilvae TaxID=627669 RepID=A0A6J5DKA0_9BURK|nr:hypothetical protein [Paraburkholderia humisilvae]CAB3754599.1 hypothetical protein LMG29542_02394 [Paraburkholderia humisilvae]
MKKLLLASLVVCATLAACGGGGGGSANPAGAAAPASGASGTNPAGGASTTPTNPFNNQQAPGASTTTVTGEVFNSGATVGATVAAYLVNADGSNGTIIGTATTGTDGTFSMTLNQSPYETASYVRLVATGGTYTSTSDNTTQTNSSLELVTPYITTAFNNFVITPLTHVASQRTTQVASTGGSLANAYTSGAGMALSLIGMSDPILSQDTGTPGVDYLALVPGSVGDTLNAYADALNAIEAYGVQHDLPSSVVEQVLSQSQLTGNASTTLPNGMAINIGQWQSGTFDTSASFTLATLEAANANEPPFAEMHQFMLWEYGVTDCASGNFTPYFTRFPLAAGEPNIFTSGGACTSYGTFVSNIDAKVATNQRSIPLVTGPGYVPQTTPVVGVGQ